MAIKPISLARFPAILTHRDMAIILDVDEKTVRNQCADGVIPAVRRGRDWEIYKKAFISFMSGNYEGRDSQITELTKQVSELTMLVKRFVNEGEE